MVELGWAGIVIPEDFGGLGFGYMGLGVVMEECGRTLTASPLSATAVGATAIMYGGSDDQKSELLPQVAGGELLFGNRCRRVPASQSVWRRDQGGKIRQRL
ncbi:MAG: acyl-CoA dehydrogenase family protein [Gammaproteobacteria bacterium]|nr:acyl-CoA dehydrogenase family protein [Gammaproteobacteria bacterium]